MPSKTTARFFFKNENGDKWEEIKELTGDEVTSLKEELEEREEYVKVIRCKYCKHRETENGFCKGRGWPMQLVPDDGFCDKGERSKE